MKKFLASASILALASVGLSVSVVTPALALSANEICATNADLGFPSHGACVSSINKGAIVDACKSARANIPAATYEAFFGGTGLGACISTIHHYLKSL